MTMSSLRNIFWLGIKELRALAKDPVMIIFMIWAFGGSIYTQATGMGETVDNSAIAIVDEDQSHLSRSIADLFYPPFFQRAKFISADEIDGAMDAGMYTFVIVIPNGLEKDIRAGRPTEIQVNADATAALQASLGAGYIQNMVTDEIDRYRKANGKIPGLAQSISIRRAFNANGTQSWFRAIASLADQLSLLTIILTGAALLREREHGTIEHLLVMPLTAFEIALAKVWSNGLVVVGGFLCSLLVVVEGILEVPIAGSHALLLLGTSIYVLAAAAIGIFLGTIARTMGQFALLMMMTVMPMIMLSGGISPVESQPYWVQQLTWLLPSRHYVSFMQAIVYRGAGFEIVWQEFAIVLGMGLIFLASSLMLFRRSVAKS
jgi:ABC-2 type transport system permease protein